MISRLPVEVRWGECDAAGIVYHPVYLDWFSTSRIILMREYGIHYMKDLHDVGVVLVVLDAHCRYRKPLRVEDRAVVETTLTQLTKTRLKFSYRVLDHRGDVCVEAETEHAFVNPDKKPINLAKYNPGLWDRFQHALSTGRNEE